MMHLSFKKVPVIAFVITLSLTLLLVLGGTGETAGANPLENLLAPASETIESASEAPPESPGSVIDNLLDPNATNQVSLNGEVLFTVESSAGSQTRTERAREFSQNIRRFAENRSIPLESLRIHTLPNNAATQIIAGNEVLVTLYQSDAEALDDEQRAIAQQYLEEIKEATSRYRTTYSPQTMLFGALKTGIATLILFLLFWVINRTFRWLRRTGRARFGNRIQTIRIGSRDFIDAQQIHHFIAQTISLSRLLLLLGIFSIYFNTILSFFPQTRSFSFGIFASIFSVIGGLLEGFIGYIPNLVFLIVLGYVTVYLLKFVRFVFDEIDEGGLSIPGFDRDWAIPTARIAQVLILALVAVVAFPYLPGSGSGAFQGISIFLGILISLGSSSAIANIIAGILLTYTRAFRIGDEVEISGVSGIVIEKGLLVVRLRTLKNYFVSIPNAEVLSTNVTNFRLNLQKEEEPNPPPIVHVEVGFDYDVPWQKVYDILLESARNTRGVLQSPSPYVFHEALNDSSVVYEINAYTEYPEKRLQIRSELYQQIFDRCQVEGIQLSSPQYFVMVNDNVALSNQN